jgi:hypothetical protein
MVSKGRGGDCKIGRHIPVVHRDANLGDGGVHPVGSLGRAPIGLAQQLWHVDVQRPGDGGDKPGRGWLGAALDLKDQAARARHPHGQARLCQPAQLARLGDTGTDAVLLNNQDPAIAWAHRSGRPSTRQLHHLG